ncbi:helix-turn-helix domain-containing protein [Steroidobacter flavus]|uniref:Helix-turn-helix domain-containing protein n=1 Tax=Steroidobacter flavus TaxID=1842136 RepID=A0ABV8SVF9_9GAMM
MNDRRAAHVRTGARVLLRHYLRQELAMSEIARALGVSWRTVYHWIETGQLDRELDNEAV